MDTTLPMHRVCVSDLESIPLAPTRARETLDPFAAGYITRPSCPGLERPERGRNCRHQLVYTGFPYVIHMLVATMLHICASQGTLQTCTHLHYEPTRILRSNSIACAHTLFERQESMYQNLNSSLRHKDHDAVKRYFP